MNVYFLDRINAVIDYDEACEMVIVAETEEIARALANKNHHDEGAIWADKSITACTIIDSNREAVICIDVNNG